MTPREEQIAKLTSTVPCVECQNPDSPFGSHDCDRFRHENFVFPLEHPKAVDERGNVIGNVINMGWDPGGDFAPVSSAGTLSGAPYWVKTTAADRSPAPIPQRTPHEDFVLEKLFREGTTLDIEDGR